LKSENDPITDDEWLLRRVRVERFRLSETPVISPNAFEPRVTGRGLDHDGISLYREACLGAPIDILATIDEPRRREYGIVRIPVARMKERNLAVEIRPEPPIPGHVVIPELNAADYAANKARFTPIKKWLAEVASEEGNIVSWPSGSPGSS
jgi:hypothetical protein